MKINQITKLTFIILTSFALGACTNDGPVENAGEAVDEAAEDIGDGVEEAFDDLEDAAD